MSAALTIELRGLKGRIEEIDKRLSLQGEEMEALKTEIHRIQVAKRPDRPPIRVPKMPRALQSIGVGLVKE
ncbi:MAG: hypothetical protein CMN10_00080 [Roseobacter sp.]|jgi:hypothetical protein|nr:hypothetical protein [Roseobacter sp.]|tara:strand:- start:1289 stop:1501 length:213 start_codon:yes stop_codon:yes gene_type:complete